MHLQLATLGRGATRVSTPRLYRLFAVALLAVLTVPRMTQRGMFGDGLLYATIARNMSLGSGSFWAPACTDTLYPEFFEHPPLGFALQAAAFWLLGDHLAVERLFSLVVFGLHALVLAAIWRRVQPAAYDWLPLLFWILPSTVTWGVINNMLENSQALLTSVAVLLLLHARAAAPAAATLASAAAGLAVVAAVLTKGPVGLFVLAAPVMFLLLPRACEPPSPKRVRLMTVVMLGVVCLCALALAAYEPSRRSLTMYVQTQLLPSVLGEREVNPDQWASVRHLGIGIAARMSALLAVAWLLARGRRVAAPGWGTAMTFFAIALCASVPIANSPKVAGHYFLPSVPLFALGFASLALGPIASLVEAPSRWSRRVPSVAAASLMAATMLIPLVHGPLGRRDQEMLRNLDAIAPAMPRDIRIGACQHPDQWRDWAVQIYVHRWFRVSLDARDQPVNGWLLQVDGLCAPPPRCSSRARGEALTLFRC